MRPNEQQMAIVNHVDGPCLVAAVPGSGKTASVTERIKNLVRLGKEPASILAITFTNKAADEMKKRISEAVGSKASEMTVCTFHSLCARILRAHAPKIGLTQSFTIYDEDDQERLLKSCVYKVEGEKFPMSDWYLSSLMEYIEGRRNSCLSHVQAVNKYKVKPNQVKVLSHYFSSLRASNAIDFTGLLSEVIRLFSENPAVLSEYRNRFKYVTVDEVQDTNVAQYAIIKMLVEEHRNIVVVGDLDQSVFGWRGAAPENILQFEKDFGAKVLKLEKNYRSTPQILKYSQNLIEKNKLRKQTSLKTDNPPGSVPRVMGAATDDDMATRIADDILKKIGQGVPPAEIAVFYRANHVSRVIEEALRAKHIKYRVMGGQSFFNRKEVKGALSILKLLCNSNDHIAFDKCCELCCRGAGPKTVSAVIDSAVAQKVPVMGAARAFVADSPTPGAKALKTLVDQYDAARKRPPGQGLLDIAQKTCFWERMAKDSTTTNDRCENIAELSWDVEKHMSKPGATLSGYLQSVSLLSATDDDDGKNEVKLMTLHSCKGLEYDVAYLSHLNRGMIPHARCLDTEDPKELAFRIEEERRLLYVGMTRARKYLSLCFCWMVGKKEMEPSEFLYETGLPIPAREESQPKKWLGYGLNPQ